VLDGDGHRLVIGGMEHEEDAAAIPTAKEDETMVGGRSGEKRRRHPRSPRCREEFGGRDLGGHRKRGISMEQTGGGRGDELPGDDAVMVAMGAPQPGSAEAAIVPRLPDRRDVVATDPRIEWRPPDTDIETEQPIPRGSDKPRAGDREIEDDAPIPILGPAAGECPDAVDAAAEGLHLTGLGRLAGLG
jgi:hypothetical protein